MQKYISLKTISLVKRMIFVVRKHEVLNSELENLQLGNPASGVKEQRYTKLSVAVDSFPARNFLRHQGVLKPSLNYMENLRST